MNVDQLIEQIWGSSALPFDNKHVLTFIPAKHIIFDKGKALPEHPNGMIFDLVSMQGEVLFSETYFSIGGGFINTVDEISRLEAPLKMIQPISCAYPFSTANEMMQMAKISKQSIAQMKRANELDDLSEKNLNQGLDDIWKSMQTCLENGLKAQGTLPGGLDIKRRAKHLYDQLCGDEVIANVNDWLCAVRGGSVEQVEKAAEIALEHHLGMTCDPVNGLVQVPCIERNGFGAIKAFTAASLALRESGDHFMPLDNCIAAMKQTGLEMSLKYKETSLGGLAVSITEC